MENQKSKSTNYSINHEIRGELFGTVLSTVSKIDAKAGLKIAILDRILGQEPLSKKVSLEIVDSMNMLCDEIFKDISNDDYLDYNSSLNVWVDKKVNPCDPCQPPDISGANLGSRKFKNIPKISKG